jgi:hypothetical protein
MNLFILSIAEANAFQPVNPGAKNLAHGANIITPVLLRSPNDLKSKRFLTSKLLNSDYFLCQ